MKKMKTRQLLIASASLIFVLLLRSDCFAECTARISGRVTIDGSTPVVRVDVHLLGPRDSERTVRTNNDGEYVFAKVCPGSYRVRPGPAFLENARQPSAYRPSSQEVIIPSGDTIGGGTAPVYVKDINFERTSPPGQGGTRDPGNFIEDKIKIDESVRSGADLKLAREIEDFLESSPACKEHLCELTIKVRNGRVAIAGAMDPNEKSSLTRLGESIGGIRRLDISGVRSKEGPQPK